jgi:hypothetical protein
MGTVNSVGRVEDDDHKFILISIDKQTGEVSLKKYKPFQPPGQEIKVETLTPMRGKFYLCIMQNGTSALIKVTLKDMSHRIQSKQGEMVLVPQKVRSFHEETLARLCSDPSLLGPNISFVMTEMPVTLEIQMQGRNLFKDGRVV